LSSSSSSIGFGSFFLATPTITSENLNWNNYSCWSASIQLWFRGQGHLDHLETKLNSIHDADRSQWQKIDFQLCAIL